MSTSPTRKQHTPKLAYESLESRQMLAGVVNVDLYADDLFIRGDRSGNEISISLDPDLGATVKGGEGTRVEFSKNATAPINIALLNSIFIFMGSGDDVVAIDGNNPNFNGNISVQLAGGDDTLFFVGDSQQKDSIANDVRIHCSSGTDFVFMADMSIADDLCLTGGLGNDQVILQSVAVNDNALMSSQTGSDSISIANSNFEGNTKIAMGIQSDHFESVTTNFRNRFKLNAGIGSDSSSIDSSNEFAGKFKTRQVEFANLSKADQTVDSLRDVFEQKTAFMQAKLRDKIQNAATRFSEQLGRNFIQLELDPQSQTVKVDDPTPSLSVQWDEVTQEAIAATDLGPTVASRALGMVHTAIYDAWSAYDEAAISTQLDDQLQQPASQISDENKSEAMSFAAFRVLDDLFASETESFQSLMDNLGYDSADQSRNPETPAGVGNLMADAILEFRHTDGSNQTGNDANGNGQPYSDTTGYVPPNPVGIAVNIEKWTPERVPIDSTPETAIKVQKFLTPQWTEVTPFALSNSDQFRPEPPEPFLLVDGTTDFENTTITLDDGTELDINRDLIGTVINPVFISQAEALVETSSNLTDDQKLIAEFWEDANGTAFPPGTWHTFGQYVSARDNHSLDQDAKMFLALSNAIFDAGIATWDAKVYYDYVRPVRAIRELGRLGLIGEFNQELDGFAIDAWTPEGFTQTILATDFLTYQTPGGNPSPPFSEYASGHSSFSAAGAAILQRFSGSDNFGASVSFEPGESRFEPGATPSQSVTLTWDTFTYAAREAGLSRRYGGIHFADGDLNGERLGQQVAEVTWQRTQDLISGNTAP